MTLQFGSVLLLAALAGNPGAGSTQGVTTGDATVSKPSVYDNYKEAYEAAKAANRPVLVILNPGADSQAQPVDVDALQRSAHRRELLVNYVIAVIDTSTPDGQKVHKLFESPALPRVSVIDKQQKWQIYRTSRSLSAEDWNMVLQTYRSGFAPAVATQPRVYKSNCPNCNLNNQNLGLR
ncbi:MAG: hypothetical protein EXS05_02530 [Planctomycetaceae bacterium]|nr:hypothetical protein [Planctomycetaceae bacterium]